MRELQHLIARLRERELLVDVSGPGTGAIDGISLDSRTVGPGGLFVAVAGSTTDGHRFVDQAVKRAASGVVVQESVSVPETVTRITTTDSRRALGELASAFHGDPSRRMSMCGVTGTNGKTTTAWLIAQALEASGEPCGFMGTIGWGRPPALQEVVHTTPDALAVQQRLAALEKAGSRAVAMEASSHALDQERTAGIAFDVGVFTNLTRDHLDYHGSLEAYGDAKARLFRGLGPDALCVYNTDDPHASAVVGGTKARRIGYGTDPAADVRFAVRGDGRDGMHLRLDGRDRRFRLSGGFNAYNLAAAYAALDAWGLSPVERLDALEKAEPPPGRFELIPLSRDRAAIVDYAHTPDALENVLRAARRIVPAGAALWCVFGCGGDRDRGKRPLMGEVAERQADRIVVTSDNPRTEDQERIERDIRAGLQRPDEARWLPDRAAAIAHAVRAAAPGDVVLVAGKGHETYQVLGTEKVPFDDRAVILGLEHPETIAEAG